MKEIDPHRCNNRWTLRDVNFEKHDSGGSYRLQSQRQTPMLGLYLLKPAYFKNAFWSTSFLSFKKSNKFTQSSSVFKKSFVTGAFQVAEAVLLPAAHG